MDREEHSARLKFVLGRYRISQLFFWAIGFGLSQDRHVWRRAAQHCVSRCTRSFGTGTKTLRRGSAFLSLASIDVCQSLFESLQELSLSSELSVPVGSMNEYQSRVKPRRGAALGGLTNSLKGTAAFLSTRLMLFQDKGDEFKRQHLYMEVLLHS